MNSTCDARVSVIVPCYNAEPYVVAALRSVLDQQWDNLEIIVVDDGSTDRSVETIRSALPAVRVVQQENKGVASARNVGLRMASGRYVAFLDADDYWLPDKLRLQVQLLASTPRARMAYGAWHVWHSRDARPSESLLAQLSASAEDSSRWAGPTGWIYPDLLFDCEVWTSTVLAERSLFEEIGQFDESLPVGEDYDLWLRASRVTPILRVKRPLALYRMHDVSITKRVPAENYQAAVVARALTQWGYASPDGRMADRAAVRRGLARTWRNFASAKLREGCDKAALQAAFRAILLEPSAFAGWRLLARALRDGLAVRQ